MPSRTKNARSPEHVALGRSVREWRVRRELSQEQLAKASSMHRNYVGAVERGEINLTMMVMLKLARGLALRPSAIVLLAEERYEDELGFGSAVPLGPMRPPK
jgi:transcriptional regulator with XRE-family HTH domain